MLYMLGREGFSIYKNWGNSEDNKLLLSYPKWRGIQTSASTQQLPKSGAAGPCKHDKGFEYFTTA